MLTSSRSCLRHYRELVSYVLTLIVTNHASCKSPCRLYLRHDRSYFRSPLHGCQLRLPMGFRGLSSSRSVQLVGLCSRELRSFTMVKRFLAPFATSPGFESLIKVRVFWLVGAESVAAEFGIGPTDAREALFIGAVFDQAMQEPGCVLSALDLT